MRLCLDEHYSAEIAVELRSRGFDVQAVTERSDLAGLADTELWAALVAERRALLTENVADFMPLVERTALAGESHFGLVLSPARSMPRSRSTIGLFVARLDELLGSHPAEDAFRDRVLWLAA